MTEIEINTVRESLGIKVSNEIPMTHFYSKAPKTGPFTFLRFPHRHIFKLLTTISVTHDDRDIEFFDLKQRIDNWLDAFKRERDSTDFSCEMLARYILKRLSIEFGSRDIEIEVSEDGENSAILTRVMKTVKNY